MKNLLHAATRKQIQGIKKMLFIFILSLSQNIFAQPSVKSFTPLSGPVGATITINGKGFSKLMKQNIVYFGAVRARIISVTDTSIAAQVPAGATYQPLSVTVNNLTAYADRPFVITFNGDAVMTPASFASKIDLLSGNYPFSICSADLDGDTKADIISANYSDETISVFRNTAFSGFIFFAPKVDFTTAGRPGSVVSGDVNGDGKLDIIVASDIGQTVSVYKNTSTLGNVSFDARQDYATGVYPVSVSVADLNADGKPELIVTNNQMSSVSVYKNTSVAGSVSFDPRTDFGTGNSPSGIAVSDFNGDDLPDLAIANQFSNSVSILSNTSNNGNISFASKVDFTVGTQPYNLSAGDLDGDGRPDIAVANIFSNSVSVLRNRSRINAISFEDKIDYPMPSNTETVTIGDLNGDGRPDLAVAGSDINVSVLQNKSKKGRIVFGDNVYYYLGGSSSFIITGDGDGDGKPEIMVSNFNKISVLKNIMQPAASISLQSLPAEGQADAKQVSLQIFPNPASEYVTVQHPASGNSGHIKLVDLMGKVIKVITADKDALQTNMGLKGLLPGSYIIIWSDGKNTGSKILLIK